MHHICTEHKDEETLERVELFADGEGYRADRYSKDGKLVEQKFYVEERQSQIETELEEWANI